jgi:hypothetical protein
MKNTPSPALPFWRIALLVAALAAATGVAFASWLDHGAGIFLATVESGLAWCF